MNDLAGTSTLLRLALRRDRIMLVTWVYLLTASVGSSAYTLKKLYPTEASREQLAVSLAGNGSLRALYGPLFDHTTVGGLTAWRIGVYGATLAALMSSLLVVRHTRAEEEAGRLELVGAGAVGRRAPLTAALLVALFANLLFAALATGLLLFFGQAPAGAVLFGLSMAGCGLVFAGVAAVTAQLAETGRAANGSAGALLGIAFTLRAAGDAGSGGLSWFSPIGWSSQTQPFAANHWALLLLPPAVAGVLASAAYALVARRDLGAGLLSGRPGPAAGAPGLRTPFALARRLQGGSLAGWCVGFAAAGAVFGALAKGVVDLVGSNSQLQDMLRRMGGQQGIVDSYLASITSLMGMLAAVWAVQSVLRLRAEETGGLAEPVLGTAVSRLRWAAGHLLFALPGAALPLLLGGLTEGLAKGAVLGDTAGAVRGLVGAALVQLPAVWLTASVAVALFGLRPDWTAAGWGVLAAFLLIGWLGPVVQAGRVVLDLSPFSHLPHLPGGHFSAQPLLWLTALACVLTTAGLAGLRRRDIG